MENRVQIWVSGCPKVGERVVFQASGHEGRSRSAWQDGVVVETASVPNADSDANWALCVEYVSAARTFWMRGRITLARWCAASDIMAVIKPDTDLAALEKMYKL
jgi:hypothetical protein